MSSCECIRRTPRYGQYFIQRQKANQLDQVLDDLRHARGQKAEHLYTYVYRHIWERLDDLTQRILLLMPLAAEQGADLAFLTAMVAANGIDQPTLRAGLDRLVALNLVESRGDLHQRRYAIHSLTPTFLQQDVLRWGREESGE